MSITIWHNPRCSKSRAGLAILEELGVEFDTFKYLVTPFTEEKIEKMLKQLNMSARELMRTKEKIYKELNLKTVTDEKLLIKAMVENPKLVERPIVIKDNKAVIGRPLENINLLLDK